MRKVMQSYSAFFLPFILLFDPKKLIVLTNFYSIPLYKIIGSVINSLAFSFSYST
jgi:hypothetical protein